MITATGPAPSGPGHALDCSPEQRKLIGVNTLVHLQPVVDLAAQHGVSRKFCYQQAQRADWALQRAFAPAPLPPEPVLFYLPVTRSWIRQWVLGLALVGHASLRGIQELAWTLLDEYPLSLGHLHSILSQAAQQAKHLNRQVELSGVHVAALDEIYQADHPVLVGMDLPSSYCFLLSQEDQCDATTWGVRLLELSEGRGLRLDYSVADAGQALRSGQAQACPGVACQGDVFHALRQMGQVVQFLEHRARWAQQEAQRLQRKLDRVPGDHRQRSRRRRQKLHPQCAAAGREARQAQALHEDLALLERWMGQDVLAVAGEDRAGRRALFDWIVQEVAQRQALCPHRLTPLAHGLALQRDALLAFVQRQDEQLAHLAQEWSLPLPVLREVVALEALDQRQALYWQRRAELLGKLGGRFHALHQAVRQILSDTVRASSMVENLNSRLRNYFFLRRQLGGSYLELLQFYLNHHCYVRSAHAQRVGRSPAELLSGQRHRHWLEMLGYSLFRREAVAA